VGGVSYARVAQTQTQAVVGTIIDQDTAGTIYLTLDTIGATLSSITTDQRDAGQNIAAVGSDGQWEIIQFQTATLTSGDVWELSDITRGLEQTTSYSPAVAGERFVLLTGPGILRIAEGALGIGVEKQLKVVSCGESLASVTATDFTTQGLSYVPPLTAGDGITIDPDTNVISATLADGDKGDITVSGSGTIWTIDNDAVTYAKIQNVSATSRILGRATSGAGDIEELTASQVTTILGVVSGGGSGGIYESTPTKPLASAYSLENAGTASMADGTFGLILTMPSSTSNIRFVKYTAGLPGSSWTAILRASGITPFATTNIHHGAILLRNSGNSRLINFAHNGANILAQRWSSYTGFNAGIFSVSATFGWTYGWKKVTSDGTTLSFYMSPNGVDWGLLGTEAIATYISTVDEIGFGSVNGAASGVTNYDIFESFTIV
jgi:hypothetical protein